MGEFIMTRFKESVERLTESVREMLAASKLLRSRVENSDEVLLRIENTQRGIADRLDHVERDIAAIITVIGKAEFERITNRKR